MIPNLVEVVKGYAKHEKSVLVEVTDARARATAIIIDPSKSSPEDLAKYSQAQGQLGQALGRLLVASENYPNLKANENFQQLQMELTDLENKIAASRRFFNNSVSEYNTGIQQFPAALFAASLGFQQRTFFDVGEERAVVEKAPQVKF